MYENRALKEIFGSMREEAKGDCRKLHNENKKCGKMNSRITSWLTELCCKQVRDDNFT